MSASTRWRALALGSLALFLLLSLAAAHGPLPGDVALRATVKAAFPPEAMAVAHVVNLGGTWMVLLPAAVGLYALSRHARARWWLWGLALVLAPVVENTWKALVGRPRPEGAAYGFPSGHATAAAVFVVVAIYISTRTRLHASGLLGLAALVLVLGLGVGAARIVLDAHWASDVLGGWLLGAACGSAAAWWDAARNRAARGHGMRTAAAVD